MTRPLPMQDPMTNNEVFIDYDTYIEPFIGWRAWEIVFPEGGEDIRLKSFTYDTIWEPEKELTAVCKPSILNYYRGAQAEHECPHKDHGCGIHAVLSREDSEQWHGFSTAHKMRCVGEVKLWGVVYRYTRGYLAQYAYPKAIWVPHEIPEGFPLEPREIVRELRTTYRGVEVRLF